MNKPLLLWGGTDIGSSYYGQRPHRFANMPEVNRDRIEFAAVNNYINDGIPVIGVCRGGQLLCVANGGSLWQHSEKHVRSHSIMCNKLDGSFDKTIESVAAGHHQIMNPSGKYIVLGWAGFETTVYDEYDTPKLISDTPEVVWWPDTNCLAVQPHPEWMISNHPFNIWIDDIIKELFGIHNYFKEIIRA
jgi:gamma-glutamyl-gamma-aminobutyrate hydrolase PuuD